MDLSEFWQRHKSLLIPIGIALVLYLIGQVMIGSIWDVGAVQRSVDHENAKLRKIERVKSSDLESLGAACTELRERNETLSAQLTHDLPVAYQLPPGQGTPQLFYSDCVDRARKDLVFASRRQDISVVSDLGMPEFPPADRDEVITTLRALSVISQVVNDCVEAGVRSVDNIQFKSRRRLSSTRAKKDQFVEELPVQIEVTGSGRAISRLIEALALKPWTSDRPFLALGTDSTFKIDVNTDQVEARLQVVALQVNSESD